MNKDPAELNLAIFLTFGTQACFMSEPKNIHLLYISRWYPTAADPMLGLFVRKHALAAAEAGYIVTTAYATPRTGETANQGSGYEILHEGRLTEVIVGYDNRGIFRGLRQAAAWIKAIRKAAEINGKPQLIHAHILTRAGLLALFASCIWRIPYLVTEHWSRYYPENLQFKGFFLKKATQCVIRHAAAVTVVSKRLENAMHARGLKFTSSPVGNVVDTALFHPEGRTLTATPRILNVSCFEEKSKNLRLLIDAFTMIHKQFPEARLILTGEGSDRDSTEKYAAEKNLPAVAVQFTGMLTGQSLAWEMKQATCLAISSNYETFGIVAYEAMACGVPVVTTDVADLKDFIGERYGRIVPDGDVKAMAEALAEVIEKREEFPVSEMAEAVAQAYGSRAVTGQLNSLYQVILRKR